jgi:hypothetical protein
MSDETKPPTATFAINCPECRGIVSVPSVRLGEYVRCTHCDAVFPYLPAEAKQPIVAEIREEPTDRKAPDPRRRKSPLKETVREEDEDDRPHIRRSRYDDEDEDDEDTPRKKKRRRKKRKHSIGGFDPLEALPLEYSTQTQIAAPIAMFFNLLGFILTISKNDAVANVCYVICLPFWFWACAAAARSQGRSAFNCFYGLLGPIGFYIVVSTGSR